MNCEPASVTIMIECEHDFGKRLNVRNVFLLALRY